MMRRLGTEDYAVDAVTAAKAFVGALIAYLVRNGLNVVAKEKESSRLTAMRRSILFPGLLHELGLSAFKDERFMMKIEAQDQGREYKRVSADIRRCGFFWLFVHDCGWISAA